MFHGMVFKNVLVGRDFRQQLHGWSPGQDSETVVEAFGLADVHVASALALRDPLLLHRHVLLSQLE